MRWKKIIDLLSTSEIWARGGEHFNLFIRNSPVFLPIVIIVNSILGFIVDQFSIE